MVESRGTSDEYEGFTVVVERLEDLAAMVERMEDAVNVQGNQIEAHSNLIKARDDEIRPLIAQAKGILADLAAKGPMGLMAMMGSALTSKGG